MNDVMPGSDGPENLKILKTRQFGVHCRPGRQTIFVSTIRAESWELTLGHVSRHLGCLPKWKTREMGSDQNDEKLS